jgi:hypothetical protein
MEHTRLTVVWVVRRVFAVYVWMSWNNRVRWKSVMNSKTAKQNGICKTDMYDIYHATDCAFAMLA